MSETIDPHAGQGGSYELDPVTGKRTLKERTQEPTEQGGTQDTAEAPDAPKD